MFKKSFKILLVLVLGVFFISGVSFAGLFIKKDGTAFNGELAKSSIKFTTLTGKTLNIHSADIITMIRDKSRGIRIKTKGKEAIWGEMVGDVKVKTDKEEVRLEPKDLIFYCFLKRPVEKNGVEIIESTGETVINFFKTKDEIRIISILPEYWRGKILKLSNPKITGDSVETFKFSLKLYRYSVTNYEERMVFKIVPFKRGETIRVCTMPISMVEESIRNRKEIRPVFSGGTLRGKAFLEIFVIVGPFWKRVYIGPANDRKMIEISNTISNVLRLPIEFKK